LPVTATSSRRWSQPIAGAFSTPLRTRNDQLPDQRQVKFRIGVNLGDVMVQNGDLLGDGVNVAARLQAAAEPGGICISGSVYDQIRNKLSLSFKSLGERTFKNIPQPVRAFSITETEDHKALPASRKELGRLLKWGALAAVIVLIAGGIYLAYSKYQSDILAARREARSAIERAETRARAEEQIIRDAEAARRAEIARQQAAAEARRRDIEDRRLAEAQRSSGAVTTTRMPATTDQATPSNTSDARTAATTATTDASSAGTARVPGSPALAGIDGVYAGGICLGDSRFDPARCFRGQAAVTQGKVSGQWPAREPGLTTYLWGDVSTSGDAVLHFQTRKSDGSPMATANLTGRIVEGRLDATGAFLNGRSIQLNWRKN
jgi:adenylate/guanylate cyclase family protein